MSVLEIKNINKHYSSKKHALKDFSYSFTNGIYGILGPNGAGKTTLMNIITDNIRQDKDGGKILWNGKESVRLKEEFRSQVGYMPQQQSLYHSMRAGDFLRYIAALKNLDKKTADIQVKKYAEKVEMSDTLDLKMGGFSGGMKQRILIASALIGEPELIILDEPTAGLDPRQRIIIRELISELQQDRIVIISTHIVEDIEKTAKEILLLKEGTIIESGTVESLLLKCISESRNLESLYMQYYGEQR